MTRLVLAALMISAVVATPAAGADPQDLEPHCTGGQVPTAGECLPAPAGTSVDDAPGSDPGGPLGLDPASTPAV